MRKIFVVAFFVLVFVSAIFAGRALADPAIQAQVQTYFANAPVMVAVARCESGFREFAPNGTVLHGGTDNAMIGIFQIDEAHTFAALALGYDISTVVGNMGYANFLYGQQGTGPWVSSIGCWGSSSTIGMADSAAAAADTGSAEVLTMNLSLGMVNPQILTLQQLLNKVGYTLAASGPGSPGNETMTFGALTYAAVHKFQCAQGIACSGDESSTGYGLVDSRTRAALLALAYPVQVSASAASSTMDDASSSASSSLVSSSPSSTPIAVASTTAPEDPAEIAELQSRIASLVIIVEQLEAELAKM